LDQGRVFIGWTITGMTWTNHKASLMAVTIYGIKNCDTMKKARAWLDARSVAYAFHDYKAAGIDKARLEKWADAVGWEVLVNRAGTTFRGLPESDKAGLDRKKAIRLMMDNPSLIKRPVLESGGKTLVGFKPEIYQAAFG
jgi:Spx/MgsR family transcriptional regulator